jgi:transposase-like protein
MGTPKRRRYSDTDQAHILAALAANGGNVARTARQVGVPRGTLQQWGRRRGVPPDVAQLAHQKKAALADRLEAIAYQLLDAMSGKAAGASLLDLARALGILVDKLLLLRAEAARQPQT